MHTRTTGEIATKPTGNAQGGHWFYSLATGRMLDRLQWNPLPIPSDVIEMINILAKASQAGMNFTNMRNELYDEDEDDDSDADSDTDSGYNSDDASSDEDDSDDIYDYSIAGVDTDNPGNSDPDTEEADENNNDGLSAGQDEDEVLDDISLSEENVNKVKNLTDNTGVLPPIIQSRTRKQAKETGKILITGAEAIKTVTKKQRKFRKEFHIRLLKRKEEENKKSSGTN
jgi:hypothetical protein